METLKVIAEYFLASQRSTWHKMLTGLVVGLIVIVLVDLLSFPKYFFMKQRLEAATMLNQLSKDTTFSPQVRQKLKAEAESAALYKSTIMIYLGFLGGSTIESKAPQNIENIIRSNNSPANTAHNIDENFRDKQFFASGTLYLVMALVIVTNRQRFFPGALYKDILLRVFIAIAALVLSVVSALLFYWLFWLTPIATNYIPWASFVLHLIIVSIFMRWLKRKVYET